MDKKGEEKEVRANLDKFLEVKDSLVQKGFIEILSDNEESRYEELNKRKEEYEKSKKQYEIEKCNYNQQMSKMKPLTDLELVVYNRLFEKKDVVILSEHKTFYKAFNDIFCLIFLFGCISQISTSSHFRNFHNNSTKSNV